MEQEQQALEDQISTFLHGPEDDGADYQPDPKPVQEGAEAEPEEVEAEDSDEENEPQEAAEDVSEGESEGFVEVEFDGVLYEVPEVLKDALLRQSDYTQKTQEVSLQRKQADLQLQELQVARDRFEFAESIQERVAEVQRQQEAANQYQQYLKDNLDSLSSVEIERLRLAIGESKDKAQEIQTELQQKYGEFQQAQEQSIQELLKQGTEILKQKIPGWGDESQKQLRDYAVANGFSEQEIQTLIDPRQVEVLWKASQYDALKAGATPAVKKVQAAPKIEPKARNPMPDDVKQKLNLRKKLKNQNLSAYDKANLIGDDIASRFFK